MTTAQQFHANQNAATIFTIERTMAENKTQITAIRATITGEMYANDKDEYTRLMCLVSGLESANNAYRHVLRMMKGI